MRSSRTGWRQQADGKTYPPYEKHMGEVKKCRVFDMVGVAKACRHLRQYQTIGQDGVSGVRLYGEPLPASGGSKAMLAEGIYDKITISEKLPVEIKGEDMNPCLITLPMSDGDLKDVIATYHIDYLTDVTRVFGDTMRLYFSKESGYGYFATVPNKWK